MQTITPERVGSCALEIHYALSIAAYRITQGDAYTILVDVFSFGVMLYAFAIGSERKLALAATKQGAAAYCYGQLPSARH